MNKRDSVLLDKMLQILTRNFQRPYALNQFYDEDGILNIFSKEQVDNVFETYGSEYIKIIQNEDVIRIKSKYKDIIESYGSLSKYLTSLDQQNKKAIKRRNWITISPIIINVIAVCVTITLGTMTFIFNNKVNKLEKQIIEKDSIIRQFSEKINNPYNLIIK